MFLPFPWILGTSESMPFDSNPIDSFFQGLVGACGISVVCNLMRVYYFLQTFSDSESENESKQRSSSQSNVLRGNWKTSLQFWSLVVLLSLVGSEGFLSDSAGVFSQSCFCLGIIRTGRQLQKPRLAPHPEPVLPGLRPHLYSGIPPSGGSTQLLQLVSSSCSQLGTGKHQPQSVEPCG
ncbi:hypothetical protein D5F01_LYC03060 [Larimichthys crocea]|uniref:Uncharacterized protein n=1 Tax=Larimichthys crocea TaxID=215358 RepID=A0A6G0J488_LARCR|nr:hypothetical protein D5F01_LYC03060 [Larimichthys crocea]